MSVYAFSRRHLLVSAAVLTGAGFAAPGWAKATSTRATAASADGLVSVTVLDGPRWMVRFAGRTVIAPSMLGFVRADGTPIGPGATFVRADSHRFVGSWKPPYGIHARYDETYSEATARFRDMSGVVFDVVVRAYATGVGVRYVLRSAPGGELRLAGEATQFTFPHATRVVASRDEGEYFVSTVGEMNPVADPPSLRDSDPQGTADVPLTAMLADGTVVCVSESDRLAYPRLMLKSAGPDTLVTHTMCYPARRVGPSAEKVEVAADPEFVLKVGEATPWRVLMIAAKPERLIENAGLVPTMAGANVLGDVSWVKPGKAFRIRLPYTNAGARKAIAFAQAHKIEYIEFDWHWYGNGTDDSDATVPISGLDMPAIVAEARKVGIGTILYVDRAPIAKQLDAIVRTYESWGVAGVKFGFVWEGTQAGNADIVKAIRACGEHHLLADLHDDMRPAGLERTFPNYINLEGVRGNEHFPTARHNVTLAFTRNLGGPMDYTICYAQARNRTTNAHQLAMAAVYYMPLNFVYWYDAPEKYDVGSWPALSWFDEIPTAWDETRAIAGEIGAYVVVARKRSGRWFLGAMTDETARTVRVPLSFLGHGRWLATVYADGAPTQTANKTEVVITQRTVTSGDVLSVAMNACGGQAIRFEPVV